MLRIPSKEQDKSFPLSYLLILYEHCNNLDMYGSAFEQFELLVKWLSPIDLTNLNYFPKKQLTKLERSYQLDAMSLILNCDNSQLLQYYNHVINNLK